MQNNIEKTYHINYIFESSKFTSGLISIEIGDYTSLLKFVSMSS